MSNAESYFNRKARKKLNEAVWEDATAAQVAAATAARARRKFVDLDKALQQVPLIDPELKSVVRKKIQQACGCGEKAATEALNELIVEGKAFDVPIPSTKGHAPHHGVCRSKP